MNHNLKEVFKKHADEYLQFKRIDQPRHQRPDVCAFLMLHDLVPGDGDMVSCSEHDEFFLAVDCAKLAIVATDEQIRDLVRCGVRYSSEYHCLSMFA